jgi:hypothetical protein
MLLIANEENVKVVQALMRHGSARITVDTILKPGVQRSERRNNAWCR